MAEFISTKGQYMIKAPYRVNLFLIVYLIAYISLSLCGGFLFSENILSVIVHVLPVILGLIYLFITRQSICTALHLKRFHPLTVPFVILFTYCLWPLISIANMLSLLFADNMISDTITGTVSSSGFFYSILTMAFVPALVEEFTFRGILYGQYRAKRPIKAIFLSALCFGLMHMNFNQFCYAFLIGMFLALLVEATGSLFPSMIMHFTFNATSVSLVYLEQKLSSYLPQTEDTNLASTEVLQTIGTLLPFAAAGCVLALLIYKKIAKLNGRDQEIRSWFDKEDYRLRPNIKVTSTSFYVFVIICLIMCLVIEYL